MLHLSHRFRHDTVRRLFFFALALAPTTLLAECIRGTPACNLTGPANSIRECVATVMCDNAPCGSGGAVYTVTTQQQNVSACLPMNQMYAAGGLQTVTITARAMRTAATPRVCGWKWTALNAPDTGPISIDQSDGLPVELLDFAIVD